LVFAIYGSCGWFEQCMCLTALLLGSYTLHGDPAIPPDLVRFREPFDHPDWVFEVKDDGFRALAHITGHHCELRSRNGHVFKHWPQLCEELAQAVKAHDAIIVARSCASIGRAAATLNERPAAPVL
jgi:hypothetical protein